MSPVFCIQLEGVTFLLKKIDLSILQGRQDKCLALSMPKVKVTNFLQLTLCIYGHCPCGFNQLQRTSISKRIAHQSKRQYLDLLCAGYFAESSGMQCYVDLPHCDHYCILLLFSGAHWPSIDLLGHFRHYVPMPMVHQSAQKIYQLLSCHYSLKNTV